MKIVTTFSDSGYREYAERMLQSIDKFWPQDIGVVAYYEGVKPAVSGSRFEFLPIFAECQDLLQFLKKHKDMHIDHEISKRNYNRDVVRFAPKSYVIAHATTSGMDTKYIWLDADTVAFRKIDMDEVEQITDCYCAYLGRKNFYSETGFLSFDATRPPHFDFMREWREYYNMELIFRLERWHDCEVFDTLRKKYESKMKFKNLTPEAERTDHVFIQSVLGNYMDHLKGPRKKFGRSSKSDLGKVKKSVAYWN